MRTIVHNVMLAAFGIASVVNVSGRSGEAALLAITTDRLPVAATSGGGYVTVQPRLAGSSVLCRLPIQISNLNIGLFSRCIK